MTEKQRQTDEAFRGRFLSPNVASTDAAVSQLVSQTRQQIGTSDQSAEPSPSAPQKITAETYPADDEYEPPVIPNQAVPYENYLGLTEAQPIGWLEQRF